MAGIVVRHQKVMTSPDDPAYDNQPSDWNSDHAITFDPTASDLVKWFSAGSTSISSGTLAFANSNGLTWGLNTNGQLTGSVQTNYAGLGISVTGAAATLDTNGLQLNISGRLGLNLAMTGGGITGNSSGLSLNVSDRAGTNGAITGGSMTVNSSGISINLPAYITTARASTDGVGLGTAQTNVTWTVNSGGISLNAGGYAGTGYSTTTTSVTGLVGTLNSAGLSIGVPAWIRNVIITAGTQNQQINNWSWADSNGVSFGLNVKTLTASVKTDYAGTGTTITGGAAITLNTAGIAFNGVGLAGTGTSATNASVTLNSAGLQISVAAPGAATNAVGLNTAGTNITWTVNSSGISINAGGYAGTGTAATGASVTLNSAGISINVPGAAATNAVGLNTAQTNVTWTVNTSGISIDAGGYAGTGTSLGSTAGTVPAMTLNSNGLSFLNPEPVISSYENMPGGYAGVLGPIPTVAGISAGAAFQLPQNGSFSFLRIPVVMATSNASITANATMTAGSGFLYSTWNAVVYSLGTGASSRSLISVASGSNGWTIMNAINFGQVANSTLYSITQAFTANAYGGALTAGTSTQYSQTSASAVLSAGLFTNFSSQRFLDINFANLLSAGPFWLIFGVSTSSTTSGQGGGGLTGARVSFSSAYGASQLSNVPFNAMGDTAGSSGGLFGVGSFSTVGGGTTSILPISAISSVASHWRPVFQILRSA